MNKYVVVLFYFIAKKNDNIMTYIYIRRDLQVVDSLALNI